MVWKEFFIHWLHLTAAIIWVGGMIFTGLILNPILRSHLEPQVRFPVFRDLGRRFQTVEAFCVAMLLTTGIFKLSQMGPAIPEIFHGSFGKILAVKLILVAMMLILSFLHSVVWGPKLGDLPPDSPDALTLSRRLVFWARVNLALGLAVVACAAMLHMNPF